VPAVQTHHDMTQAAREALGITDNLIRVSVGLEDARDLIDDIVGAIHGSISDKRA
jgi:cystathionine gamma-synthase